MLLEDMKIMFLSATHSVTTQKKKRLLLIRPPRVRVYKSTLEVSANLPASKQLILKERGIAQFAG